ncbi:MAG: diguanylate cyclase [Sulfurospirillum sp.]|nr:diguanylate cyclase [Sulfurospirillum sp.]
MMPEVGDERVSQKLSYVQGYPQWQWYIGTGLYIDDIENDLAIKKTKMFNDMKRIGFATFIVILIGFFVFARILFVLQKKMSEDFTIFRDFFSNLIDKNKKINLAKIRFDEFVQMGIFANNMLDAKVQLEEHLRYYKKIVSASSDFLALVDKNSCYYAINQTYLDAFGKKESEFIGHSAVDIFGSKVFEEKIKPCNERALSGESFSVEKWFEFPTGRRYLEVTYFPIKEEGEEVAFFVVSAKNMTQKKLDADKLLESEQKLQFLAHYDVLTNLPNKTLLTDRIEHAIANAKREESMVAVCFIDLDNFKKINDGFGHSYGDDVLIQSTKRITQALRAIDTLSRIGGDEFILLLEHLKDIIEVEEVIKKVQVQFTKPFLVKNQKFFISASVGIALFPQHGLSIEELIRDADIAMYKAKDAGKNTYRFYNKNMSMTSQVFVDMENALKEAIQQEQFVVYYQPQLNLISGECVGLEALVRWNHPTKGIIAPNEFIKFCEEFVIPLIFSKSILFVALVRNISEL